MKRPTRIWTRASLNSVANGDADAPLRSLNGLLLRRNEGCLRYDKGKAI